MLLSPNLLIVYYQTVIDQTLTAPQPTFELDFSSTIKMSDQQNDSFIWMSEQFPECNMTSSRSSVKANSSEMNEFRNKPLKEN